MPRRHPCDCCGAERKRWQRLCGRCWSALPRDCAQRIIDLWHHGARADWRAAVRRAKDVLARPVDQPLVPSAFYARTAAMLGERD